MKSLIKLLRVKVASTSTKKKKDRRGWESPRQLRAASWTPMLHRNLEQDAEEMSNEETQGKVE